MKTETIEVPRFDGYRCIGNVKTKSGQYYTTDSDMLVMAISDMPGRRPTYERIQPKRYVFEETGETRPLEYGDFYINHLGEIHIWDSSLKSASSHKILRSVEE